VISEAGYSTLPYRVSRTVEFFQRRRLWYILSRNFAVTSCRDAASRRWRLGKEGIPLYDELRTYCAAVILANRGRRIVLCHCRANAQFDMDAIGQLLGTAHPVSKLSAGELLGRQAEYGTVNPFAETSDCIHVFDEDLLARYTPPHTMMTNAGERTWAIEFHVADIIDAIRRDAGEVYVASIARPQKRASSVPVFGIIGGGGPEGAVFLWRSLNEHVFAAHSGGTRFCYDISYPRVIVQSLPEMGLTAELSARADFLWPAIETAVARLCADGVTHIALACHVTHYFSDRIQRCASTAGAHFVSAVDVAGRYIHEANPGELTIVGVSTVASLGRYSAYRHLAALGVRPLDRDSIRCAEEIAQIVKRSDPSCPNPAALNRLQHLLGRRVQTAGVLLAFPEASIVLERFPRLQHRLAKTIIDSSRLYGNALSELYFRTLPESEPHCKTGSSTQR
jgi:aspartate/glutamate racemase/prolyl-tRNA editing enzyme YbaK/EbsC (Cys-tRNA(Pro) deacylase)